MSITISTKPFENIQVTDALYDRMKPIRQAYNELSLMIVATAAVKDVSVGGRQRAIALTELETSFMWAMKSMAMVQEFIDAKITDDKT